MFDYYNKHTGDQELRLCKVIVIWLRALDMSNVTSYHFVRGSWDLNIGCHVKLDWNMPQCLCFLWKLFIFQCWNCWIKIKGPETNGWNSLEENGKLMNTSKQGKWKNQGRKRLFTKSISGVKRLRKWIVKNSVGNEKYHWRTYKKSESSSQKPPKIPPNGDWCFRFQSQGCWTHQANR